ncbi:leucyl aminopeptidase family protein [Acidihalobacter prosperus]|uniref:Peptidase B n=1 Tax=Acidihalobacter prosperus TaxID=160660 RepID=A0A1A6C891_9GAMM|nr:leucyl aminopeptidase family protein [Acidihalobacter prosperus]OBS10765.1 Peptidase B [Acidihalobacter prosperus]
MEMTLPGLVRPTPESGPSAAIHAVGTEAYEGWLTSQTAETAGWLAASGFKAKHRAFSLLPGRDGSIAVLVTLDDMDDYWGLGDLPYRLPEGDYRLEGVAGDTLMRLATGWGLGAYRFQRYKSAQRAPARLCVEDTSIFARVMRTVAACTLVRDLVNTPAENMGPAQLAATARALAEAHAAECRVVVGDTLLSQGYPAIHAVGRASVHPPRLIDLRWGETGNPEIVLVGKGVCFDTGGLDLKNASGMRQMKKDMGGAAHVLGLARMIMEEGLPVRLRVLIPAVENAVSGDAFRPGDVLRTRKGLSVEVDNTDAEGRLVLCDALADASEGTPALIVDFATLTGAARVALGTELPAFFTHHDALASALADAGKRVQDPLWRLPLFEDYRAQLDSGIADLLNCSTSPFGGAITAALFLDAFVPRTIDWVHIDLMAWNQRARPGRPRGGEAMGLRAVFAYLKSRYGNDDG